MAGQPGLLPEPAGLVNHRQPEVLPQSQGELAVEVVAGGVQDGWAEFPGQPGGQVQAERGGVVGARRQPVREQPVVGHAVHRGDAPPVQVALRHREPGLRDHVRVEARLALGRRNPLGAHGVAGVGGRQRVGDQVQHPPGDRPAVCTCVAVGTWATRGTALGAGDAVGQDVQVAGGRRPQRGGPASGRAARGGQRVAEPALADSQPGEQHGPGRIGGGHPVQRRPRHVRPVHGQGEGGQPFRRGAQQRQRRLPVTRSPQHGGPAVRSRAPQPGA